MLTLTRRQCLHRLANLAWGAIAGYLVSGCATREQPAPDAPPTIAPTATFVPRRPRPDIVKTFPAAPSTVVRARHAGVWAGEMLVPAALREMLAASITALTGLADAREAWAALFRPDERIAIKVNTITGSSGWTHAPLVAAVTDCLQEVGVPAEQIVIYDRDAYELKNAGFPINEDGPGVRCCGTGKRYTAGWRVAGYATKLSDILLGCDALINMPILKQHMYAGISFAMKNHYGTMHNPQQYHGRSTAKAIPELNALPPIQGLSRLIIGDALQVVLGDHWDESVQGDSIFASFDPVAHDAAGLRVLAEAIEAQGGDRAGYIAKAEPWLQRAAELGLGTCEEASTLALELSLG